MKIRQHIGNIDIHIDMKRIDHSLKEAQKLLNMQVVADCDPLIPFQQGALRNSVNYPSGTRRTLEAGVLCGNKHEPDSGTSHESIHS